MVKRTLVGLLATMALCTGGVVLATSASAHTPSASVDCTSWSVAGTNYDPAESNTYGYSVDGAAQVTGTFGASFSESGTFPANSGNHTLKAFVYENGDPNAQYSHTYDLASNGCLSSVPLPPAPQPTSPTCSTDGSLAIPGNSADSKWLVDGSQVNGGQGGSFGPGTYTVSVHTPSGYVYSDGSHSESWTITVLPKGSGLDCRTVVTPVAPTVVQAVCAGPGNSTAPSITLASTPGVDYTRTGLVVTATAQSGYKFGVLPTGWTGSDTVATYTVSLTNPGSCLVTVTPVAPTITTITKCGQYGSIVLPNTLGVDYKIVTGNGSTGRYVVTATPQSGYVLADGKSVDTFTGSLGTFRLCPAPPVITPPVKLPPVHPVPHPVHHVVHHVVKPQPKPVTPRTAPPRHLASTGVETSDLGTFALVLLALGGLAMAFGRRKAARGSQ